jgi:hypothetical protein|tara:strand:- start:1490 stop:1735 length:246 start_codon:yes stop_codon:yes gene_type:complete
MDPITIVYKIQRMLKEGINQIQETYTSGSVDNMEKYKYLLGKAHALQIIQQEISNLLEQKEQKNEQGNVIDFGKPEDKDGS